MKCVPKYFNMEIWSNKNAFESQIYTLKISVKMSYTTYCDIRIHYTEHGNGNVLVLLHGYIESANIWEAFTNKLDKHFRVICIDLPGHGKSDTSAKQHTMEFMADCISEVLNSLNINSCVLIGHSMGGYVALEFLRKYSSKLAGFCLFHSLPFADTEEKKQNRLREIELIKSGKKQLLLENHYPKIFAKQNVELFSDFITVLKSEAKNISDAGIIKALEGMKNRSDLSEMLANSTVKFLYIIGKFDNFIPQSILEKIKFPAHTQILLLENSGHIGFIEEPEKAENEMKEFCEICFNKNHQLKL